MPDDYSVVTENDRPTNAGLAELHDLVNKAKEVVAEIDNLSASLELKEAEYSALIGGFDNDGQIVAKMKELGLKEFKTNDGLAISIGKETVASLPDERKEAGFAWLEANDHAALIKREVLVAFNREDAEKAAKLAEKLRSEYAGVAVKQSIHASTLKAWASKMLDEGKPVPMDIFGIHRYNKADIPGLKPKKKKK